MIFEWDEKKDKANQEKHHLAFKDAKYVFADPFSISREDFTEKEERRHIIGAIGGILMVLVVYTMRSEEDEEIIRIISARKATAAERRRYEAGTWF
ncbi:BrnT family toxin [Treponema sp.]